MATSDYNKPGEFDGIGQIAMKHMQAEKNMNPWDQQKWGVHVSGPDNLLPAHSFEEAAKRANDINDAMISFKNTRKFSDDELQLFPVCWAQVVIWSTNHEHNPAETDWDNACS